MKTSFYIDFFKHRKFFVSVICTALLLCLTAGTCSLCVSAQSTQSTQSILRAQNIRQYKVTLDDPISITAENTPILLKNYEQGTSPTLTLSGWIQIDQKIESYEYTMNGGKTWTRSKEYVVERPDTQKFCPNTYKTAGYRIKINVSALPRGTYDLFVRAYTDKGDVLDVLVMLDMQIGQTDTLTAAYRELNLAAYGAADGILTLQANTPLTLDAYNLHDYAYAALILDADTTLTLQNAPSSAIKFSVTSPAPVQNEDGTYTATIDLTSTQYAGQTLLSAAQTVGISQIRLYTYAPDYYTGELVVHMTPTPVDYLSGANSVDSAVMSDQTVGTFTRLFPVADTNDPYIYFNLGKYLKETEQKQISADHYRYAVISLQTPVNNPDCEFALFLCAGDIHGPNGDSRIAFTPKNDGEWHKYIIPLYKEEHWTGTVYGMRFDFVEGSVNTSHYANIASVELYPDEQSAKDAAALPFEVYFEQGEEPKEEYAEQNRAPSGKPDRITWFDASLESCFGGEHKTTYSFDDYGHLILQASESTNDPYVSFSLQQYAAITGHPLLSADEYGVIVLRIMADKKIDGKNFVLYYYSGGYNFAEGTRSIGATFHGGDEWEYLVYDMKGKNAWTDDILGMRLDYAGQINAGQKVCLADILFFKDMDAWEDYSGQNDILPDGSSPAEGETNPPETEISTIEIPTRGPGLEYIPPEQISDEQSTGNQSQNQGCGVMISLPCLAIVSFSAFILIKNRKKKGV